MYFSKPRRAFNSISARLTLWFAAVFSFCVTVLLVLFYLILKDYLFRGQDDAVLFELYEAELAYRRGGKERLPVHIEEESEEYGAGRVFFRVISSDGDQLVTSDRSAWGSIPFEPVAKGLAISGRTDADTLFVPDLQNYVRVVSLGLGDDLIIQGGVHVDREVQQLAVFQVMLPLVGAAIVFVAAITGFLIVRRAMLRVEGVTKLAKTISASTLDSRVPVSGPHDELHELALTFNDMLERIDVLIRSKKQVTDDLAHELRSPVARMRARAELALHGLQPAGEDLSIAASTIEECDRLLNLVNTVLDISEIDSGIVPLKKEHLDIAQLMSHAIELFGPVAAEKGIALHFHKTASPAAALGDRARLERVFANLIDNAIKYTPPGGRVDVSLVIKVDRFVIEIKDTGRGIPKEHLPLVCDRFFRVDRSRSTIGSGLGLSVAQSLIRSHQGTLTFESEPEHGTLVRVELPSEPGAAAA